MRRLLKSRWCVVGLLFLALSSLAAPGVLHAVAPTAAPGQSMEELRDRTRAAHVLAALFASATLLVLAARLEQAPLLGRQQALALTLGGLALAVAALLPTMDDTFADRATTQYTSTGVLQPADGVQIEGVRDPGDGLIFTLPTRTYEDHDGPLTLGPVPVTKGDGLLLIASAGNLPREPYAPPLLEAPNLWCDRTVDLDSTGVEPPMSGAVWKCTALDTGTTRLTLTAAGDAAVRDWSASVSTLSVLHAGFLRTLDEALATLGAGLALGAGSLAWWERRRTLTPDA